MSRMRDRSDAKSGYECAWCKVVFLPGAFTWSAESPQNRQSESVVGPSSQHQIAVIATMSTVRNL